MVAFAESAKADLAESVKADLVKSAKADLAEGAEEAFEEIADHVKNLKQHVQNAARNARFRSSQAATGLFIARNAIRIEGQEETDSDSMESRAS